MIAPTASASGTFSTAKYTAAPQLKLENEDPQPETISYDELVKSWQ